MSRLTIDTFLYVDDFELSTYKIMDSLKVYTQDFRQNLLYPGLSELSELNVQLRDIVEDEGFLKDLYVKQFHEASASSADMYLWDATRVTSNRTEQVYQLIDWAKPLIRETINEGKILYDFVKRNMNIEEIGESDSPKDEGYVLIPNNRESLIQVLRYEISMRTVGRRSQRRMNTQLLDTFDKGRLFKAPEATVMDLFKQYNDMPEAATFICTTDLDFPFRETILPVAKRKLMSRMAA